MAESPAEFPSPAMVWELNNDPPSPTTVRNGKEEALKSDGSHCVVTMEVPSAAGIQWVLKEQSRWCTPKQMLGS